MNGFLIQTILAAGNSNGEKNFWIQILVFLLVAVAWGVYSLVRKKPGQLRETAKASTQEPISNLIDNSIFLINTLLILKTLCKNTQPGQKIYHFIFGNPRRNQC